MIHVANLLSAKEIYKLATIWLEGKTDISLYKPGDENKGLGQELFSSMERLGILSWTELSVLVKILKSINRFDLVEKTELFMTNKRAVITHTKEWQHFCKLQYVFASAVGSMHFSAPAHHIPSLRRQEKPIPRPWHSMLFNA